MVDLELLLDELADRVAERLAPLLAPAPAAESWRLLDVEQTAERLGRSTRWVRERAKRGDLPFVRLDGGGFAFEEADLQAFARARRVARDELEVCAGRVQAVGDRALRNGSRAADRVENRRVRP
jgi:excisionase family DNA binding protein